MTKLEGMAVATEPKVAEIRELNMNEIDETSGGIIWFIAIGIVVGFSAGRASAKAGC